MELPLAPDLRKGGFTGLSGALKRLFDIIVALIMLPIVVPVTLFLIVLAKVLNGHGVFIQKRIGRFGETFKLYKICSMRQIEGFETNVTTDADPRITPFGKFIRKAKLDEFPQLWNVLKGDMSFVGPRPDVAESYLDLSPQDAIVLCVRPGITGLASIEFKNEEAMLAAVENPEVYNREVIFPAKVKLNKAYIGKQSLWLDIKIMLMTVMQIVK